MPKFRLYWSGEFPLIWSIDDGDASTERCVTSVRFESCGGGIHLHTSFDLTANNATEPRAWLEGNGEVRIKDSVLGAPVAFIRLGEERG